MSRIAIMQPYVFPYIGYFQLIRAVDVFVFYNDVNFIKKGWIHRNRLLLNGSDFLFTIPCAEVSQNKRICDIKLAFGDKEKFKLLATVSQAYRKSPQFENVYPLIERIIGAEYDTIDKIAISSVTEICKFLGIKTEFLESKGRYHNDELKKADRLIDICKQTDIKSYINALGGQEIYTKEYFSERGVDLQFLKPLPLNYLQYDGEFVPWLSIVDVLMFNDREHISKYLNNFELI